eukprot:CAMPEP_0179315342 /NCGR_PEP_ID=MMETSP0797-20121207/55000_1 /TAXON_ID=47934 /ORGANISM="Dinophysis acuminata, Strain DAEP01" /LENGTH=57 /DNA_ID=CAMNT_0021025839 /DNA_START=52 /DNA_END=224 /DNA_ORIENTATION=-
MEAAAKPDNARLSVRAQLGRSRARLAAALKMHVTQDQQDAVREETGVGLRTGAVDID